MSVLRLETNSGKGDAVLSAASELLAGPRAPDAIVVLDADGQHPPDRIPLFVAAAEGADLVIGDRTLDLRQMPRVRRFTNRTASALLGLLVRRRLPDTQCGMRLLRAEALRAIPLPAGRYEAETLHLRAAIKAGLAVAWVPIPAIYDHRAVSSFRPFADTGRVLRAIIGRPSPLRSSRRRPAPEFWRHWARVLSGVIGGSLVVAALMPVLGPLDERLFLAINSLGEGPDWVYRALDPHTRNYIVLGLVVFVAALVTRVKPMAGVALAILSAAFLSDVLVQVFYFVYDRPRPEEVLDGQFLTAQARSWAEIEAFPSGHLVVTTAIAAAGASLVPGLRPVLWLYVAVIALTRVTFGAHFPLDVVVGAVFGYEVGRFSVALTYAFGLLRAPPSPSLPQLPHGPELEPAPADAPPGRRWTGG